MTARGLERRAYTLSTAPRRMWALIGSLISINLSDRELYAQEQQSYNKHYVE